MDEAMEKGQVDWWYGRMFFYELAHVVFSGEPSADLLAVLMSEECRATLNDLAGACPALEPLASRAASLPAEGATWDAEVEACLVVYNRVIAGLGGRRVSHPWESAYTSNKKLLMQRETLEVREAYRAFGYLPEMYPKVADDHLSLECAFMGALAQKSVAVLESAVEAGGEVPWATIDEVVPRVGDEAVQHLGSGPAQAERGGAPEIADTPMLAPLIEGQRAFLRNHLLKWVGVYARDLHEDAPGSLYDHVATALAAFAEVDARFLD